MIMTTLLELLSFTHERLVREPVLDVHLVRVRRRISPHFIVMVPGCFLRTGFLRLVGWLDVAMMGRKLVHEEVVLSSEMRKVAILCEGKAIEAYGAKGQGADASAIRSRPERRRHGKREEHAQTYLLRIVVGRSSRCIASRQHWRRLA
jgi:hypothetical protein